MTSFCPPSRSRKSWSPFLFVPPAGILLVVTLLVPEAFGQSKPEFPFQNPELSLEARVNDLVGRLTLEEKIGQMMNAAPAIPRLGIPEYNWWNECLHGVARAGLATVFPQAIGLAATLDAELMLRVSTAIGDEARVRARWRGSVV